MAKKIHDMPAAEMNGIIYVGLKNFREGSYSVDTAHLARIKPCGPAAIPFPTHFSDEKSPEQSYQQHDCEYPGLVI